MAKFTVPRDIYHGKGSLESLKTLKGKKAMGAGGGGGMKRFGFLDRFQPGKNHSGAHGKAS